MAPTIPEAPVTSARGRTKDTALFRRGQKQPRSVRLVADFDLGHVVQCLPHGRLAVRVHNQHQESAAASAAQLSSRGACIDCPFVPHVDAIGADAARKDALDAPRLVKCAADLDGIHAIVQDSSEAVRVVTERPQCRQSRRDVLPLFGEDAAGAALNTRPEHHQVSEQILDGAVLMAPLGLERDASIGAEGKQIQPAERRSVLILLANRTLQHVDFDLAGLLRELARSDSFSPVRVQRVQKTDGKAAGRAEPREGRKIRARRCASRRRRGTIR